MTDDALARIDVLIQVGMRIARSAPNGHVALARAARAIDPVWIPRPWGEWIASELDAAEAAAAEPVEFKRVERALREAWGVRPREELDEFDPVPVAVTPVAQVHRAVLDGAHVAVKVLRPGLPASVRQDLTLLEGLVGPLAAAFPATDPRAILTEVRERVLDELDLESEAQTQRRFHRALRNHPFLTVPAPVTRLAREGVLVSEWIDGVPLAQAPNRDGAAARLVVFALGAARSGLIHADLHPDDVLVLGDGRVAILELGRHSLGELSGAGPRTLDIEAVGDVRERLFERPDALTELVLAGAPQPQDLWPLRGTAQLFSTIARVGATGPWQDLARAALRDGWDARPD